LPKPIIGMAEKTYQSTEPVVQQALVGRISKGVRWEKSHELAAGFVLENHHNINNYKPKFTYSINQGI
jgi:hypothetical protein